MKKSKKILIAIISLFIMLPIVAFAKDDIEIEFAGVQYAKPGDVVAYDIKMEVADNVTVTGFKANVEYDSTVLEYQEVVAKGDWKKEKNDTTNFNFSIENGINGTTTVATVSFKIKDDAKKQTIKLVLKDIEVITLDENGDPGYKHISEKEEEQLSYHLNRKGKFVVALYSLAVAVIMALIVLNTGVLAGLRTSNQAKVDLLNQKVAEYNAINQEIESISSNDHVINVAENDLGMIKK
jgi:hypothetical protein